MIFMARGDTVWGKGSTSEEALANCKKQGERYCKHVQVYQCPDDETDISGMGGMVYKRGMRPVLLGEFVNGKWMPEIQDEVEGILS